ncbi:RHS repeat-associated core domain-containing protein, partial [Dyella silvatica]|uniref:RHS repeat-associated core domain-containing protein n=1 Tax=Dyella silvatica TaxID=2992128 RepID=UPI00224E7BEF
IIESTTTTVYCYDRLGRRSSKQLTVAGNTATTRYGYTAGSRLASLTYPSGAQVSYSRNSNGQITAASLTPAGGGSAVSLVSNVSYQPFGPVSSYTLGSGQTITRSFDANGQLSGVTSPALNLQWGRDAAGNINTLSGANSESYAYDPLQRLTGINDPTGKAIEAYTYSKTGDRLSKTGGLFATGAYSYASGTHHLLSTGAAVRTYDAAGNTVTNQLGADQYIYRYNARNRLETVNRDGQDVASYTYDANGQRVRKTATFPSAIDMRFGYDEASRLLTEQSAGGSRDYVWLGELPIAAIDNTGASSTVNYVHADGLGTPRAVTNATGTTLWQWSYAGTAFGEQAPTSASGYTFNLRFPGQYFDVESGISDNIHRGYDAATGRYVQSDPIGLDGGVSTYGYVGGSPYGNVDPLGLFGLTSVDAACMRDPQFCAELLGQISRSEGRIQSKLGDPCAEARGEIAASLFDSLGKVAMVAPVAGGIVKGAAGKLARFNGPKPRYHINSAHIPGRPGFNWSKTRLPSDAESVFASAVPNSPTNPRAWFGKNADGQIYRYSIANDGTAHFSGIDEVGDGARNITKYAIDRLNGY